MTSMDNRERFHALHVAMAMVGHRSVCWMPCFILVWGIDAFVLPNVVVATKPLPPFSVATTGVGLFHERGLPAKRKNEPERGESQLSKLKEELVPPIPKQKLQSLSDHFRPGFVAREFIYGLQYMCRLFPLLMAGAGIGSCLRMVVLSSRVADAADSSLFALVGDQSHFADALKVQAARLYGDNDWWNPAWFQHDLLVAPIYEELVYRGAEQGICRVNARWWCYTMAVLCRIHPLVGGAACVGILCSFVYAATIGMSLTVQPNAGIGYGLFFRAFLLVATKKAILPLLLLPMHFKMYRMVSQRQTLGTKDDNGKSSPTPSTTKTDPVSPTQRITNLALGGSNNTIPPGLDSLFNETTGRYARVVSSISFGWRHLDTNPKALSDQLKQVQKCFGTIASSLIVQTRLVVDRRNLWGAMGAHFAFNCMFPVWSLVLLKMQTQFQPVSSDAINAVATISSSAATCFGLFVLHKLLNWAADPLERWAVSGGDHTATSEGEG